MCCSSLLPLMAQSALTGVCLLPGMLNHIKIDEKSEEFPQVNGSLTTLVMLQVPLLRVTRLNSEYSCWTQNT